MDEVSKLKSKIEAFLLLLDLLVLQYLWKALKREREIKKTYLFKNV